jgi:hypothetical protein
MDLFERLESEMEQALQSGDTTDIWNVFVDAVNRLDDMIIKYMDCYTELYRAQNLAGELVDQLQEMYQKYDELESKYNSLVGR